MKNLLKSTAAIALLFFATTGIASEPKMNLELENDSRSFVFEMNSNDKESKIILTDNKSNTIYSENIVNASYVKKFNLKNIEFGTYHFTVENQSKSVIYTLNVHSKGVKIIKTEENTIQPPIFRKVGEKVYVNLLNVDQDKVDIEILDNHGSVFFKGSSKDESVVGKTFNFEKARKGTYTINVNDDEKAYYQSIVIH